MQKSIAIAVIVMATLTVHAQQGGGSTPPPPPQQGSPEGSKAMRPPPPNPEKMAATLLEKFDADKDGKLNVTELTAALSAHRPQRGPHSETNAPRHAEGKAGDQAQDGKRQGPPAPESTAAKMIEGFAADKTALTLAELQQAFAAHRPMRGGPGGRHGGPQGDHQGPPSGAPQQGGQENK